MPNITICVLPTFASLLGHFSQGVLTKLAKMGTKSVCVCVCVVTGGHCNSLAEHWEFKPDVDWVKLTVVPPFVHAL